MEVIESAVYVFLYTEKLHFDQYQIWNRETAEIKTAIATGHSCSHRPAQHIQDVFPWVSPVSHTGNPG